MESLEIYLSKQEGHLRELQQEIDMFKASGLPLLINYTRWGKKEIILLDAYERATDVELNPTCGCCVDKPYLLQFTTMIETHLGSFKSYLRHENWENNPLGFDILDGDGDVHDEDEAREKKRRLLDFYQLKGVPAPVLAKADEKMEEVIDRHRYVPENLECEMGLTVDE